MTIEKRAERPESIKVPCGKTFAFKTVCNSKDQLCLKCQYILSLEQLADNGRLTIERLNSLNEEVLEAHKVFMKTVEEVLK